MHFHEILQHYGSFVYLIIFFWTFLEGETIVLLAGAASRSGELNPWFILIVAWMGSFIGDTCYFILSRHFGKKILKKHAKLEKKIEHITQYFNKYSTWFVLFYRFLYGLRSVSAAVIANSNISLKKFIILNMISAFIWSTVFTWTGYFAGVAVKRMLAENSYYFFGGSIILVILVFCFLRHRNKQKLDD